MPGNEKFLTDMRESVKGLMEAEPYYANIAIISERLKDIDARIEERVGKFGGLAIVLVTPQVGGVMPNILGANFTAIKFAARIFENTKINKTGKEALDVAIYTAAFWSQIKPDSLSATLKLDEPAITLGNDPKYLTYDVSAITEGGTRIQIPRLDAPAIDFSNLMAVVLGIGYPTPGASIFYTLDGSPPVPRNPSARLWQGNPFQFVPQTFNDGTRGYTYSTPDGAYALNGHGVNEPDTWYLAVYFDASGNETAAFYEIVAGANPGQWNFTRIAGAWQLTSSNTAASTSTPPVLQDNFSFFTGVKLRARAWLAGYLPSAETTHTT